MINEIAIKNWDNKVVQHPKLIYPQCNDVVYIYINLYIYQMLYIYQFWMLYNIQN